SSAVHGGGERREASILNGWQSRCTASQERWRNKFRAKLAYLDWTGEPCGIALQGFLETKGELCENFGAAHDNLTGWVAKDDAIRRSIGGSCARGIMGLASSPVGHREC